MPILLALSFFLSGFCALIYESVWIFWFSRMFGSTVLAMGCVVATYFVGLSLGSTIFGRVASSCKNPIRLYVLLEFGIGIYALLFRWITGPADSIYSNLYPYVGENPFLRTVTQICLSAAVLLPPTILMGGSLPLLLKYRTTKISRLSSDTGFLYGLNTLGAALGSLLSGYWLMNMWGTSQTNTFAGMLNFLIALAIWMASKHLGRTSTSEQEIADKTPHAKYDEIDEGPSNLPPWMVLSCVCVSGFVCMSYEMTWLRYLSFYFNDTIFLYTGILAVFIFGLGIGSLLIGSMASRVKKPALLFALLQLGAGLCSTVAIFTPIFFFQNIYRLGSQSATNTLLLLFAMLILPTLLMGATIPVAARLMTRKLNDIGSTIGSICAINTMGGVLGLLCSTFLMPLIIGMQGTIYLLLILSALIATCLVYIDNGRRGYVLALLPLSIVAISSILIESFHLSLPSSLLTKPLQPGDRLLEVQEGPSGITWATADREGKIVYLWQSGARIGRGGRGTSSVQGFIPMLIAPNIPKTILGLAFGAGLSSRAARSFPEVQRMDFVDISPENVAVALRQIPENAGLSEDPRARFITDDAYGYLKHNNTCYDLILVEPTPPRFSFRCADLYTREFYDFARMRLAEGGLFAQVLALGDLSPSETTGIMSTFSSVFSHCILWKNGGDCLMLGSMSDIRLDATAIESRLHLQTVQKALRESAPQGEKPFVLEGFLSGFLLNDAAFRSVGTGHVYTDDKSALRFTTGREITSENIRKIHASLSPWQELEHSIDHYPTLQVHLPAIAMQRAFAMTLLYKQQPIKFYEVFLAYVQRYSLQKESDLLLLRAYLNDRGMIKEIREVDNLLTEIRAKDAPM